MASDPTVARHFLEAARSGRIVFLVGSGVSREYPACLPVAWQLLELSADLFLPRDHPSGVAHVVASLQPEIFYEELSTLVGSAASAPLAVVARGAQPTLAHHLIVRLAADAQQPVVTVNFDSLLEVAAKQQAVSAQLAGPLDVPGQSGLTVAIWKVHGSADRDDMLYTMPQITQPNRPFLQWLARIAKTHHLCFIGYSGRDVDIFPEVVWEFGEIQRPFWIDPAFGASPPTAHSIGLVGRARLAKAYIIDSTIDAVVEAYAPDLLARLVDAGIDVPTLKVTPDREAERANRLATLLDEARTSISATGRLDDPERALLLALCLHRLGAHLAALRYLEAALPVGTRLLSEDFAARAALLRTQLHDCVSDYDEAERSARLALRETRALLKRGLTESRIGLRVQALHAYAMAKKMQLGPSVNYFSTGAEQGVNFRPSAIGAVAALLRYIVFAVRMRGRLLTGMLVPHADVSARRRARYGPESLAGVPSLLLQGWAKYVDHQIILHDLVVGMLRTLRLAQARPVQRILARILGRLRARASALGDPAAIAHVGKQTQALLEGSPHSRTVARELYELITDPLNEALVFRNAGLDLLRQGRPNEAKIEFEECLTLAMSCGSHATALKAMAGIIACGSPVPAEQFEECATRITGKGYARYIAQLRCARGM